MVIRSGYLWLSNAYYPKITFTFPLWVINNLKALGEMTAFRGDFDRYAILYA